MKIEETDKNVYLYIACYNSANEKSDAFIVVTKAMLYDEVAIELENIGDHAILFTSIKPLSEINEKLKHSKTHYLLIDLSMVYDLESIFGLLPESDINMVKKITEGVYSGEKIHLKRKLQESIEKENFELSAPLRDLTQNK